MKESFSHFKDYINGKKVAVLGIGISNKPLIKYLTGLGARVTACDRKLRGDIGDICDEFENEDVKLHLGSDYLKNMEDFDIIFRSPSVRPDLPELLYARESGVIITSEIEEFIKYCPAEIIGVTGSDGKTTTTTLIYKILEREGYRTWLGGNIGYPLFDRIEEIRDNDKVVLELSSFQLMDMNVSPEIAIITNLSPNHLDIHKSMEEYVESKKHIFRFQNRNGILVLNKDNEITRNMEKEAIGKVNFFSRRVSVKAGAYVKDRNIIVANNGEEKIVCSMDEVKLPGLYNIENILAASAAVKKLCSVKSIRDVAVTFTGVEHRREFVREIDGVKYYNDSIATTPTRVAASLSSFDRKVILIAGGYDKKIPFDELASAGIKKVKLLILMGATAPKIEAAFKKEMGREKVNIPIIHVSCLKEAVQTAGNHSSNGDIVTLSPACASFDVFKNFEERGEKFKEYVNKL